MMWGGVFFQLKKMRPMGALKFMTQLLWVFGAYPDKPCTHIETGTQPQSIKSRIEFIAVESWLWNYSPESNDKKVDETSVSQS